jgi:predicted metal-binding membrane protein
VVEAVESAAPRRLSPTALAVGLVAVALACWIVTAQRMQGMDMGPGTRLGSAPFFLGAWVTMMAAMMLPSALPMILLYDRVSRRAAATAVFVLSYLAVWAGFGAVAYGVYRAVRALDPAFLAWGRQGPVVAGVAIAAAGLYELTPLKRVCLRHCRGPLHFVLGGWKPGVRGAVRMGTEHGAWCAGCCWGLMVILFALGVMSLTWMLVVAAVVFAQKVLPFGARLVRPGSLALVGLGLWVALAPGSVPGLVQPM